MISLLILADDLTGSLDTGVHFATRKIDTLVRVADRPRAELFETDAEVLVLDTESRHLPPQEAYARLKMLAKLALQAGVRNVYKKTDSTLRGNLGAELTAVLEQWPEKELIFLPAYPKLGRTTKNGIQYVNGVPLAETEFATDPFEPVRSSSVAELIGMQSDVPVRTAGHDSLAEKGEKQILILDAQTDQQLRQAGQTLREAGALGLLAGCAGFAEQLPELLEFHKLQQPERAYEGGVLLVAGSVHPTSLEQTAYAEKRCGFSLLKLTTGQLLGLETVAELSGVAEKLAVGGCAAISGVGGREQIPQSALFAEQNGISSQQLGSRIARGFGETAAKLVQLGRPGTIVVFGGDTLLAVMRAMGAESLRPVCEICSGVVAAEMNSTSYCGRIIAKAGGFGQENLLKTIVQYVDEHRPEA